MSYCFFFQNRQSQSALRVRLEQSAVSSLLGAPRETCALPYMMRMHMHAGDGREGECDSYSSRSIIQSPAVPWKQRCGTKGKGVYKAPTSRGGGQRSIVCCGYDQQWITGPTDYFIRNDRDVLVSFQNPGEFCLHKRINPQNVLIFTFRACKLFGSKVTKQLPLCIEHSEYSCTTHS